MDENTQKLILKKAKDIFLNPKPLYQYKTIVEGVLVERSYGIAQIMRAVDRNSFIHYQKQRPPEDKKILCIYQSYFIENEDKIVYKLNHIKSREELDLLENNIMNSILIKINQTSFITKIDINSFNRIRKIIDLFVEHLICMAIELDNVRNKLTPFLFLPLDSKMFADENLFSINELRQVHLNRNSKYGALNVKENYYFLQQRLLEKSKYCDGEFYPIYYDLRWGRKEPRYLSWGTNLFQTNYGDPI
jgi:hypothetical protein